MTSNLTLITNSVIADNTIIAAKVANSAIENRHYQNQSITYDKLAANANIISLSANAAANDYTTYLAAMSNDLTTYTTLTANIHATYLVSLANDYTTYITLTSNTYNTYTALLSNDYITHTILSSNINSVQSNLTSLISGATAFSENKTFNKDVLISGNLTVEGDTFTANVGSIISEDKNIVLNSNGSSALAEGAGLQIEGTSGVLLANIEFAASSASKFRIGTGPLTSADDITRTQDFQANDYSTLLSARSNDYSTLLSAQSNDYSTLLSAQSNDYSTLLSAQANDYSTFNTAKANDYNTYISLNANINAVSSNVSALQGVTYVPTYNSYASTGSNVFFVGGANVAPSNNYVIVHMDSVFQPQTEWVFNTGNNTIQFRDEVIPSGIVFSVTAWHQ